jgi:hypothetical protein
MAVDVAGSLGKFRPSRLIGQVIEAERVVAVVEKDSLVPVAALRYVRRDAWNVYAGRAGHSKGESTKPSARLFSIVSRNCSYNRFCVDNFLIKIIKT